MKKRVLPALCLLLGLGTTQAAQAQVNFIRMGMNAATLAKRASNKSGAAATPDAVPTATYQGQSFPMLRTPADQLPKKGGQQITALETELDRCHTALLATPNGAICTPEQLATMQTAIRNLAQVRAGNNLGLYQQEATFYLAENTRRQQAAAPAPATN
ncbi:MAG: hypothetical protein ACRYG7_12435 [Janthinobacterium lividum]